MQWASIIHGDLSLSNLLFANHPPARVAAMIEFKHVKSLREPSGSMAHRIAAFLPRLVQGALEITGQP